jgi:phosphoribosylformylglycinamidine synthase
MGGWRDAEAGHRALSLIVTAFAAVDDVRRTLTPQLRPDAEVGETELLLIDLGQGRNRLGGSALAQVYGVSGDLAPDVEPAPLKAFFGAIQALNRAGKMLAYHDRSDGGLFATVCEMSFCSHVGVSLNMDGLCYDPLMNDVDGSERFPQIAGRLRERMLAALFTEELGAVIQIRREERSAVMQVLRDAGLGACTHAIGGTNTADEVRVWRNAKPVFTARRSELQQAWSEVSYQIASLRDDPACAREEFDALADAGNPGLSVVTTFSAAPFVATGARPKIAILREQGVNGHVEMAAAFERAGFAPYDVHMSDLQAGRVHLADFKGFAACGGFSYGDVLGAGQGWAKSVLFNDRLRDEFTAFFQRGDSFALGVCNGCQMMAHFAPIIPGAAGLAELPAQPQRAVRGARGDGRDPRVTLDLPRRHGRLEAAGGGQPRRGSRRVCRPSRTGPVLAACATSTTAARWRRATPSTPTARLMGWPGVTTPDGRFTIMMPHPERTFRSVQMSWHPDGMGDDSPWLAMFRNAGAGWAERSIKSRRWRYGAPTKTGAEAPVFVGPVWSACATIAAGWGAGWGKRLLYLNLYHNG